MNRRLNRKLLIVLTFILFLIIATFVWFHSKLNNYETDYQKQFKSFVIKAKSNSNISQFSNTLSQISINELRKKIELINEKQKVFNFDAFGPLLDNHLVILIQVHNRVQYLSDLIKSLVQTKDINEVLLVFSHDVFDPQINSIVTSIKFSKVIQIFYPFSLQLNPNSFPGDSANDCPRNIQKDEALRIGCTNALSADIYGHYREAKYSQTKHHWWWKCNHVLDKLNITRHHSGDFMFLEEDHYLSPDAIHVWKLMKTFRIENCEKCDAITLGSYSRSIDFATNGHKIEITKWISSRHNMGFIIDRNVWNKIRMCSRSFCTYQDYNWDWSLQYISERCLKTPLITLLVSTPRVYHTGECGVHHKTNKCDNEKVIKTIENLFKSSQRHLFPNQLVLQKQNKKAFRMPKVNGGWSDPRDHELCLNQTTHNFDAQHSGK